MKKIFTLLAIAMLALPTMAWADEGMWIPMLLGRNEAAMKKAGMHISAKDIYDVNNACLKDAVMLFGSGCTGEMTGHRVATLLQGPISAGTHNLSLQSITSGNYIVKASVNHHNNMQILRLK